MPRFRMAGACPGIAHLVVVRGPGSSGGRSPLACVAALAFFAIATLPGSIAAQTASGLTNQGLVVRDSSLTPPGVVRPGIDSQGKPANYLINSAPGEQAGANLFHSFSSFSIALSEIATFDGPSGTQNVINRVTGGAASDIEGTLHSAIPGASIFLVNPSGVTIGPTGRIDVPGSFHVSTADELRFKDGAVFSAKNPTPGLLTTAPPVAFGFLGPPKPIAIAGSIGAAEAPQGGDLSIVGGDITISGQIHKLDGRTEILSVASAGQAPVNPGVGAPPPDLSGVAALGSVRLATTDASSPALLEASASNGGSIYIRGGQIELSSAEIHSTTDGATDAGPVDLAAHGGILMDQAAVLARTSGSGSTANVSLSGNTIDIKESKVLTLTDPPTQASVTSHTVGEVSLRADESITIEGSSSEVGSRPGLADSVKSQGGRVSIEVPRGELHIAQGAMVEANYGGAIQIDARDVTLDTGSAVNENSTGSVSGGAIVIHAATVDVVGPDADTFATKIQSMTIEPGAGGDIDIFASQLSVTAAGQIDTESNGSGGAGGSISIVSDNVSVSRDGAIYALTRTPNPAGNVDIIAHQGIDLQGSDKTGPVLSDRLSQITSQSRFTGPAGTVHLKTPELTVREGGVISSAATVRGGGGDVSIEAQDVIVSGGSIIDASTFLFGKAGDLSIDARGSVVVTGEDSQGSASRIGAVAATYGSVGDLVISTPRLVVDGGVISMETLGLGRLPIPVSMAGSTLTVTLQQLVRLYFRLFHPFPLPTEFVEGAAGNVRVDAGEVQVIRGGQIDTSSFGAGMAGSIDLELGRELVVSDPRSLVASRTAATGASSRGVSINAPVVQVENGGRVSVDSGPAALDLREFTAAIEGPLSLAVNELNRRLGQFAIQLELPSITPQLLNQLVGAPRVFPSNPQAGSVAVHTQQLQVDHGTISAAALQATGGDIHIQAGDSISLNSGVIDASVIGGEGGNVELSAGNQIELLGQSKIGASADQGDGGNAVLATGELLHLRNSQITTSVTTGTGGNINIDPLFVVLDQSIIEATAGAGRGGHITIDAGNLFESLDSQITASAGNPSLSGTVTINAAQTEITGNLEVLPANFLDAAALIRERCATRQSGASGSFVVKGRSGVPAAPDDALSSPPSEVAASVSWDASRSDGNVHTAAIPIAHLDSQDPLGWLVGCTH